MPEIPGLRGPIPFERDELGYPRIRARDIDDGAFALGWMHATDRAVQVQISLLAGQARLLEILGEQPFLRRSERALRAFQLGHGLGRSVAGFGPTAKRLTDWYCAGFNAAMERRGHPWILRLLGLPPEPYTPELMVLLYRMVFFFGITSIQLLVEVLAGELLAAGAPREAIETLVGDGIENLDAKTLSGLRWPDELTFLAPRSAGGSNAFAVDSAHSRTGGALLMTEPHMEIARFPPEWYVAHIDYADGNYLEGAGIPGLAWMTCGRNRHVSWAYTYAHGDCVDVLVERCRGGRYLAAGEWRPLRRRIETARIRGKKTPEQWVYWDNEYGAVVGDAAGEGDFPCLRWTGIHKSEHDFNAVPAYMTSRNVRELAEAQRGMLASTGHTILADDTGAIAYVQTGMIDVRPPGWTGIVPRAGWDLASRNPDRLPEAARPILFDPPEGYLISANERRDGPNGERWCTLPEPSYRFDRLTQVVRDGLPADLGTLARASYDDVDLCAARMMPIWGPWMPDDGEARELAAWATSQRPGGGTAQRVRMGRFHALRREAVRGLFSRRLGREKADALVDFCNIVLMAGHHIDAVLALEKPQVLDAPGLREILSSAWPRALEAVRTGRAPAPVRASFRNVLFGGQLPRILGLDSETIEIPGGPTVPFQSQDIHFGDLHMHAGPVFHMLFDMSRPGGWYNIGGGASERRFGPGYGRGVEDWRDGRFIALGDASGTPPSSRR